jgi:DNA-binding NarL/FixJ family response regulator
MPVRTIIADHTDLMRAGIRCLLNVSPRVEVVGEARDLIELEALIVREKPDVVLIDHTARGFGLKALRQARERGKRTRFVAITADPSPPVLASAIKAGVHSYVRKDCDAAEIADAVLRTADGDRFFCGKLLDGMRKASIDLEELLNSPAGCAPVTLTERECQIIAHIAEGHSYTAIAEALGLSAHTVNTHRRNVMRKLGVNNKAALVMYAMRQGLVGPNHFLFEAA